MGPLDRAGLVFFLLFHALGCQNLTQNHVFSCEAVFYSGFKRNVLTSGVGEMYFKNILQHVAIKF